VWTSTHSPDACAPALPRTSPRSARPANPHGTRQKLPIAKGMWKTPLDSIGLDLEGNPTACGEP
jgi:hypothetical protein